MLSSMSGWDKSSTPVSNTHPHTTFAPFAHLLTAIDIPQTSSRVVSPPVKDDWEDDEDSDSEHEPPSVEKNQQIWEDAWVFLPTVQRAQLKGQ